MTDAVRWLHKAAEQENADAQYALGLLYNLGEGVEKDPAEAARWFRRAADQGLADAQYELGWAIYLGEYVEEEKPKATKWFGMGFSFNDPNGPKWFRKAAMQGHADAQYALGMCYEDGNGVTEDEDKAAKWYRKAAEQGQVAARSSVPVAVLRQRRWPGEDVRKGRDGRDDLPETRPQNRVSCLRWRDVDPQRLRHGYRHV